MSQLCRTKVIAIFAAVVLLSVVTGCAKEKAIKLGHIGDYTGIGEMLSTSETKGQLLAIEEINAAGGILGRPLEYLDRDGALKVDIGVSELKDLIVREKIDFALGPCSSSEALALQAVTGDYDIIRVSAVANTEAQTVDSYNGTTLQVVVNTYMEARGQARRIHRDFPHAKKFYCLNQDYEFGYREQAAFEEEIKRLVPDAVIVGRAFPKLGEPDYSPFITAMLTMKDDIDFVQSSLYGADIVAFTKQAKDYDFFDELPFMALYDIDVLKALGKDAPEGVYGFARGDFFADPNPKMMGFVEKYRAKYKSEYPSGFAVLGYDAIYALKAAIEKAGTTDTDAVREALKGMDFTGLRGYTPVRAIDLMMVVPTYNGIITHESPYPFPIWREIWRIDGAEVIRAEESVLEVRAALSNETLLREEREPEQEVAVLHIGPIGDYGWTYEGHLGAQQMAEELPYVEVSEREEACGPDAPQILREYAEAGNKVILCHSYNFGEYIEEVAPDYPDVTFMWGAGVEKKAPNAGMYFGRMYEARFLAGIVAGAMTKSNKIGYAAALPTSQVVRGINAFARGVASVNPNAGVHVEWIGEWHNPPKEKEAALSLIDQGCDIITHHSDSYTPAEAAEERGVYYISFGSEMRRFAPEVFLTGTLWNWAPIMTDIVRAVHDGTWDEHPGQDWWYGLAEGGVKLARFSNLVPDDVKELVEAKKQAVIEGQVEVFPGMTDGELREIYYFEGNVVGELPPTEPENAIKIGAIYPLTGSLATTGADIKNAILLAVDMVNNEYNLDLPLARSKGIESLGGAKIEVIFGDSEGSPSKGASEVERLIHEGEVVALVGCYQSAVTAAASQAAEDKGMPFLSPTSCAPSLTERGFRWFFRSTPDDETFVQNFYKFFQDVEKEKGIKVARLAIVYEDSLWGPEFAEHAEQYAEEYGYQVVENVSYSADATNVTNEVQRLKDAHPGVVMQASYIHDAILYMQTYKDMSFSPDAILADDAGFIEPEFLKTLGDDGNYILTRATWSKDLAEVKPLVGTINKMFRERYGADMTGNSARAFTGMLVLADAINRAGSTAPEAIREALLETNIPADKLIMPWDGVKFDQETHQNTLGEGIICQIIDQEYYTVWPWNLATKEVIWPIPRWEERE